MSTTYVTTVLNFANVEQLVYCVPVIAALESISKSLKAPIVWSNDRICCKYYCTLITSTLHTIDVKYLQDNLVHTRSYVLDQLTANQLNTREDIYRLLCSNLGIQNIVDFRAIINNKVFDWENK